VAYKSHKSEPNGRGPLTQDKKRACLRTIIRAEE
jgi:hypothetical protein